MKILFTADIHIKLGQKNVPTEWTLNRYSLLEDQLKNLQSEADMVVIGGDIFDKLPNMSELEIYFKLISVFTKPTFIISGNHEALKKDTTFLSQLKFVTATVNPYVQIIDDYFSYAEVDFIPYNKLKHFEKHSSEVVEQFKGSVLITHVRGEIPPHVKPEVDLDLFSKWDAVLAGDLHSYENSQRNILYPGSPCTTSFHRNLVATGVLLYDTNTKTHKFITLELPQLIRKTIKAGEPMPPSDYHHTVYEVEGDLSELSGIEDSELLDKKIVKRDVDTALILTSEMTLEDEVREYLMYILQINEATVERVLKELNTYASRIK